MTHKYNATRVYWHPHCGYFKGKKELDNYLNSFESLKINKNDFQIFDSVFESEIHKLLIKWIDSKYRCPSLILLSQIEVDLSQPNFCSMGYKIDFLIAPCKPLGFTKPSLELKPFGMRYADLAQRLDLSEGLLIEAKGLFTSEARYKHQLLEAQGFRHGKSIEIVQQEAQCVSRGKKCYHTLTPAQLKDKLNQRFNKE